jgi:hypothetical protein
MPEHRKDIPPDMVYRAQRDFRRSGARMEINPQTGMNREEPDSGDLRGRGIPHDVSDGRSHQHAVIGIEDGFRSNE